MGYAEKLNPNSQWNKNRNKIVVNPVSTPAKRDEPMVMELTLQNIWGSLCRMLKSALRFQSPAQTS